MQRIMNSESESIFDPRTPVNLASELITSAFVGLLFGLLGLGLALLIFGKAFTFSVVIAWLMRTHEYWLPRALGAVLVPVAVATISLAVLHHVIDRMQWRRS